MVVHLGPSLADRQSKAADGIVAPAGHVISVMRAFSQPAGRAWSQFGTSIAQMGCVSSSPSSNDRQTHATPSLANGVASQNSELESSSGTTSSGQSPGGIERRPSVFRPRPGGGYEIIHQESNTRYILHVERG